MKSGTAGKELSNLATREAFNRTLKHIVNVTSLVEAVSKGANLADLLNNLLEQDIIERTQIAPIVSVILINKLNLPYHSMNMRTAVNEFDKIAEQCTKWNGLNLVVIYHHPNIGMIPINPANPAHWAAAHDLKKDELLVVYSQSRKNKPDVAQKGLDAFLALLQGRQPEENPDFIEVKAPPPQAKPRPAAPPAGKQNLTPKYSVQVTNELFHNGNVEAWKNVIESYEEAYSTSQVIVYHEGELIQDLNSLFKWGKVKHGGLIFFQIAGQQIKGVSRLQKYLFEAASPRFEAFMKHDVNKTLKLF